MLLEKLKTIICKVFLKQRKYTKIADYKYSRLLGRSFWWLRWRIDYSYQVNVFWENNFENVFFEGVNLKMSFLGK